MQFDTSFCVIYGFAKNEFDGSTCENLHNDFVGLWCALGFVGEFGLHGRVFVLFDLLDIVKIRTQSTNPSMGHHQIAKKV